MIDPANDAKSTALAAIVSNVKRLLNDARLLQESGSAGSALSLAILAFEEAGKGHIVENGWEKPKKMRSNHSYRHFIAFFRFAGFVHAKKSARDEKGEEKDRGPFRSA